MIPKKKSESKIGLMYLAELLNNLTYLTHSFPMHPSSAP